MKKSTVISLSLLLLLIACGKTPDDPGRPGRQLMPQTIPAPLSSPASRVGAPSHGLFGNALEERTFHPRSNPFRRPT